MKLDEVEMAQILDLMARIGQKEEKAPSLDVLTPEQAAEALGCEPDHVNDLASKRKLPAIKVGRSWRFPVAAMNQFLAQQALEHIAPAPPPKAASPILNPPKRGRTLPDLSKF